MKLTDQCRWSFSAKCQKDGLHCIESHRISLKFVEGSHVCAVLESQGGGLYEAEVHWDLADSGMLYGSCSCSESERSTLCRHLWATLIQLDGTEAVKIDTKKALLFIHEDLISDEIDDGPDEWRDAPDVPEAKLASEPIKMPSWLRSFTSSSGGARIAARPPRPAPVPWKSLLDQMATFDARISRDGRTTRQNPRQLWFVLNVDKCATHRECLLDLRTREVKKNGQLGQFRRLANGGSAVDRLTDPQDRELLYLLRGCDLEHDYGYGYTDNSTISLRGEMAADLVARVCRTGRFVWIDDDSGDKDGGRPVRWDDGDAWRFRLIATPDERLKQWTLAGEFYRDEESLPLNQLLLVTTLGVVFFRDRAARFPDEQAAFRWLAHLKRLPDVHVPFAAREEFLKALYASGMLPEIKFPPELAVETEKGVPRGRLRFCQDKFGRKGLSAKCEFQYGDKTIGVSERIVNPYDPKTRRVFLRDTDREQELMQELCQAGLSPAPHWMRQADFILQKGSLSDVAVRLTLQGWAVEADGVRIRHPRLVELNVRSGVDWFGLEGDFDFDGISVSLPSLLEALRKNERTITLNDGSQGVLPEKWLQQFGSLIDMGEADGNMVRFRRTQALLLDALLAEHDQHVKVDADFAEFRTRLAGFAGVSPAEAPAGFQGTLRHYQQEGLGWLNFLREFHFGGCLADDMGLGKTIQVLAMLEHRRQQTHLDAPSRPSLIVVPKSLVFNWMDEAHRFTPALRLLNYTGLDRRQRLSACEGYDVLLTTYGTLRNDILHLKDMQFDYAILDESQAIKNHTSLAAKATRLLNAEHRLSLTGTPVENHLGELWSQFEFLNPGMLGRSGAFASWSRGQKSRDDAGIALLARAMRPFLLRRTKEQVLQELPDKTEQTIICEMSDEERAKYNELRDYYRSNLAARVEQMGLKKAKIHVLEALLRLRQAACHRGLLDKNLVGESSAKLDSLLEQVVEVAAEGHKALVFSQFTSLLAIVRNQLEQRGVVYEYLDGRTRDRGARVKRFQEDPACPVFLISLKAGGHGLNLTAADYVFILDPWWNPAVEAQAVDRAHRIGQHRPVFAYRLICRDTVEDKILELQKNKRQLADAIVSADNSLIQQLTTEDLQLLLS